MENQWHISKNAIDDIYINMVSTCKNYEEFLKQFFIS